MIPIPSAIALKIAAAAATALALAGGGWLARGVVADRDEAKLLQERSETVAAAANRGREAEAEARADERVTIIKQSEVANAAARQETQIELARARRAAADSSLLDAARAAAACPGSADGAALAATSPDAAGPARGVLADVLGEVGLAGRAVAEQAQRRGLALEACVGAYNALTPAQRP